MNVQMPSVSCSIYQQEPHSGCTDMMLDTNLNTNNIVLNQQHFSKLSNTTSCRVLFFIWATRARASFDDFVVLF